MKKTLAYSSILFAAPFLALAQTPQTQPAQTAEGIMGVLILIGGLLNALVPVLIGAALIAFFWGLVTYVFRASRGETEGARSIMIWSLVALFVMVSVWGILRLVQDTFNLSNTPINAPQVIPPQQ